MPMSRWQQCWNYLIFKTASIKNVTKSKGEHFRNKQKDRKTWQRNTRYEEPNVNFRTEKYNN